MVYDAPQDQLKAMLAYLRYGILGAILTSVLLAGVASFLLTRQVTRPLSETRDAAIRVASGDYATTVPVKSRDELGELARDRKSTRLNSSHANISYAVFCLKKKKKNYIPVNTSS